MSSVVFVDFICCTVGLKMRNFHEMAELAESEQPETHRPNHYEFLERNKKLVKSVKRYLYDFVSWRAGNGVGH